MHASLWFLLHSTFKQIGLGVWDYSEKIFKKLIAPNYLPSSAVSISEKLKPKFFCNKNTHHTSIGGLNMKHIKIWPTNLIPTLQKHITTKHSNIMIVIVMYIFSPTEWWMLQCCYFWRGMKTYFSSLLMMLISSQSKTCKWNVWTQLSKLFYGGGKGSLRTMCLQKKKTATCYFSWLCISDQIHLLACHKFHW